MALQTERLRILQLGREEFRLLLLGEAHLENILGLTPGGQTMGEEERQALWGLYHKGMRHEKSALWYTDWLMVNKDKNVIVGNACFMGEPNEKGEVEIGYGVYPRYRKRGYMSEAVAALRKWALEQKGVSAVTACTDKDNLASQRVLEKCGMHMIRESRERYWWR